MSNVIDLDVVTSVDMPPTKILARAAGAKLESCIVVGWDAEGELYFSSSIADGSEANWLLDQAKRELLELGRK